MAKNKKLSDEDLIKEAKERFGRCEDWEATFRVRFVQDLKFANADPDNGWQWDTEIAQNRSNDKKPCLTINKTRQHNLIIINDGKQNKPGVNIRPVGDGASYDAAQVFEGVIRHIEYQSNAEQAYDTASGFQVQGGIGYWRVVTDYVSDDSFDQEIYIRRIKDPLSVYLDPDISEVDGSDARFGFVFDDVPTDQFKAEYPDEAEYVSRSSFGYDGTWAGKDTVRICEYYRREGLSDTLVAMTIPEGYEGAGEQIIVRKSKMDDAQKVVYDVLKQLGTVSERPIVTDEIMWYKIAGDRIVDSRPWPGKYIPIVRVVGEETIIDGQLDRKGHTRSMKDAQRMYNYWTSEGTAQVAMQTKTPYLAPAEGIEDYQEYWKASNVDNYAVLPYRSLDDNGNAIPRPSREQPPQMASAYIQGMQICENQLMMASGQYQSQFGQNENATSGVAINERQRQGDNATYHFIDGLAIGIRYTGVILLDLIPKVYDTERVIRILARDGSESQVRVSPESPQALQKIEQKTDDIEEVEAIFNPNVGRYEVQSDVGPGYATKRQEAFNAMTQIAAQNQAFMSVAGDLMWKSADFPLADELAKRWERMIPPNVKGDQPPPEFMQAQQTIKMLEGNIVELQQRLNDKEAEIEVKQYDATSKRITALGNSGPAISPDQIQPAVMEVLRQVIMQGGDFATQGSAQAAPMQIGGPMQPQEPSSLMAPGIPPQQQM
ncbi:portal protein [Martelella sp. FLE1502]